MTLQGTAIILYERTESGRDALNNPVYTETPVTVENVLIGQPETEEVTSAGSMYGKKLEYMLGIPKGDTHEWENRTVEFFGRKFKTFGHVIQGIEAMIPLSWHKKVRVAAYDDEDGED